jgi:hypothetical protein
MNSMTPQPSEIANSLSQKFQVLHDAFTELASEAAQFHNDLPVEDPASRTLFTALSRILAFSDHVHVALNLMGEDIGAVEAAYGDPMGVEWTEELEDCFDEWFTNMTVANSKGQLVN